MPTSSQPLGEPRLSLGALRPHRPLLQVDLSGTPGEADRPTPHYAQLDGWQQPRGIYTQLCRALPLSSSAHCHSHFGAMMLGVTTPAH